MSGKRAVRLYPNSPSARLEPRLFCDPTAPYRGVPFWAWNDKLNIPRLLRQIDYLKEMGFGGFLIHSRTGLDTRYLGREYLVAVAACVRKAKTLGMLAWLYDEDRWPSGFAGGLVSRQKHYRIKHLLWTQKPYGAAPPPRRLSDYTAATRSEGGVLLASYAVVLERGRLKRYRRLARSSRTPSRVSIWHAYLESPMESTWFNGQTYVDTFSRAAVERFIEVTHERLAATLPNELGQTCPGFFTDEPQFTKKTQFLDANDGRDLFMPFTTDFLETYQRAYGDDLLDHLPELFWDWGDRRASQTRYRYHDHTAERFACAFGDMLGAWCDRHGVVLTGHMLAEPQLHSQTRGGGEVMRAMRSFQMPGIDILSDRLELTTAKQAQSLAHQYGRAGVASELYGVTDWDFDFIGHKRQGDWQAALGVTLRIPHHAWYSMAGEAKRDYPGSIHYQSPWFARYPLIEDHFARIATVLTRGRPAVRVAVIHTIESLWLHWGPVATNRQAIAALEEAFATFANWLLFGLLDFDYISEALLPNLCPRQRGSQFCVGERRYDAVIVPNLQTIRSSTLDRLERFARAGGRVIFAGEMPHLVDAAPSDRAARLAGRCTRVPFLRRPLLDALAPLRDVEIRHENGSPADSILHQMRIDGERRHLFFCNTDRLAGRPRTSIRMRGKWRATLLDTRSGEQKPISTTLEDDTTLMRWSFSAHGHLLITLRPARNSVVIETAVTRWTEHARLRDPVPVTLSEPNVLLLDQAAWRINDGSWQGLEEILRIDNEIRRHCKLPPRTGREIQPWVDSSPADVLATVQLRFIIESDVTIHAPRLATETTAGLNIQLDGCALSGRPRGWWVDESIRTLKLPPIKPGRHELVLSIPFTRKTNLEWCYLLGDFGVHVAGRRARIIAPVRSLAFGDWTRQGLPFYGGNVTYHCHTDARDAQLLLEIPTFKNPLLSISSGRRLLGEIAFAPFQLELGRLRGRRSLDITAYGNRVNTFGPLHNADRKLTWVGPAAWRSTGANWTYAYKLRPIGVLLAPILKKATP